MSTLDRLEEEATPQLEAYDRIKKNLAVRPDEVVEEIVPLRDSNPENVKRVEGIVNEAAWADFFPLRNAAYTYTNFLKGVGKFGTLHSAQNSVRSELHF